MTSQILEPDAEARAGRNLDDIASFAASEAIPEVPWLTTLELDQPRTNLHCLTPRHRAVKRVMDVVLAVTLLALLWPLMLLIAFLVRLTSPGPVIFRQVRVGLNLRDGNDRRQEWLGPPDDLEDRRRSIEDRRGNPTYGRHFTLYKFRTMRQDAERHGAQFAVRNDARITPLGKFLRLTRLDELPQLWNVIRGEMSLVGPRPERPEFVEQLSLQIPSYLDRLGLKPGLTGVAQIVNGYDNELEGFQRKVAYDVLYLQNCSVWNDIKILVRTIEIVLTGKGAM